MRYFKKGDKVKCVGYGNGIISYHRFKIGELYIVYETDIYNECLALHGSNHTLEEKIAVVNGVYINHKDVFPCFKLEFNKEEHLPEWF